MWWDTDRYKSFHSIKFLAIAARVELFSNILDFLIWSIEYSWRAANSKVPRVF